MEKAIGRFMDRLRKLLIEQHEIYDVREAVHNPTVHKEVNRLTSELLKVHDSVNIIKKEAKQMKRSMDTASKIAQATGGFNR